jgi:16S rRNA (uracil1498-N3)-methyltransferase
MARRRFLVQEIHDDVAVLRGPDARHLARVLRAEPGRQYEVSDGAILYLAEVSDVGHDRVSFRLLEPVEISPPPLRLTVAAALVKFDRFEWLIEKVTELGAAAIVPVNAARSEKGLFEAARKRIDRWQRIARESSQQSRRLRPPEIAAPEQLAGALATTAHPRYFLDEKPGPAPLITQLPRPEQRRCSDSVTLLAGPEGGWTDAERTAAAGAGWTPVSLGPLILRAETAAIAAVSLITHAWWASQLE